MAVFSTPTVALRLNMTGIPGVTTGQADRYRAALEMAAYADERGFAAVNCEEHHLARNGWLPSPLILAAAVAARTRRVRINIAALLVPLYDPVRLAEDIAVLDNISDGRFSFVAGVGYRPEEYHAVGRQWHRRGRSMDESLGVMLAAWGPEPFEYGGRTIDVTPKPVTRPHPLFFVGGMSPAAARRAARFGVPFYPPMPMPELEQLYHDELRANGTSGFVFSPGRGNTMTLVHPDPDAAWEQYFPYLINETAEYSTWRTEEVARPHEDEAESMQQLRDSGKFEILTPQECENRIRTGAMTEIVVNPLVGGLPIEEGWKTLRLLAEQVLPRCTAPTGVA
ncbi:luciferase-like monooxygenase [Nocardia nova SH22a]|uniref:Luciferase-like monooxygenase n=1 Tax=Nocardia nova SH22a TaxID=1415166 RepID=W5TIY7_9NOCA|nr:LLM class flavin-dependent oxidoreductase [Nocardia nova]AHH19129.1 luciferase-like monooxygenase [Nocardia nova SH22a]